MNATFSLAKIKKIFLGLLFFVLLVSCGSFQSASYFETDGIYVSKKSNSQESSQEVTQDTYYSQYSRCCRWIHSRNYSGNLFYGY